MTATAKTKLYKAQRDRLRTHDGQIHAGEAYPAGEVTHSLLGTGWITEGVGTVPVDPGTHAAFATGELARHEPADPDAIKAFKQARGAAPKAAPAVAAPTRGKGKKAAPAVESGTTLPKSKRASKKGK